MKPEITRRAEIEQLVNIFYEHVNADPDLGPIFNQQAQVNWQSHLPKMYDFWETLLFGKTAYKGMPFPKHIPLGLRTDHFERWLQLFYYTVDTNFSGTVASLAKNKALHIANVFQVRLGLQPPVIGVVPK